ncbi:SIMPL domain-containing protein [Piscinibacter terrae]|nr:SIMPL domain-containing protein [Albitalea terrae]
MSLGAAAAVQAADVPQPTGVVSLTASADLEVAKDLMSVTLTTSRDGTDANVVQVALKQALDAALAEAKKAAKPGQVDVRTGNFSLYPRYGNKGQISGWQGTAELLLEGKDMPALGQLVGRITTLTIGRVSFGLSREAREKNESDVSARAIAAYKAKAAEIAKQFGYSGYVIREVNVQANEQQGNPIPMMRVQAMAKSAEDSSLPVEAGKAQVIVTVTGTVQLTK